MTCLPLFWSIPCLIPLLSTLWQGSPFIVEVINPDGWATPDVAKLVSEGSERRSYYDGRVSVLIQDYRYKPTPVEHFYPIYNRTFEKGVLSPDRFEEEWVLSARACRLGTPSEPVTIWLDVVCEPHGTFPKEELERRRAQKQSGTTTHLGGIQVSAYYDRDGDGLVETCLVYRPGVSLDELIMHILRRKGLAPSE